MRGIYSFIIPQRLPTLLACVFLVPLLSGCTVLGLAADTAIIAASGENDDERKTNSKQKAIFGNLGKEVDAKILGILVDELKTQDDNATSMDVIENESSYTGLCERKLGKNEACYSADYYDAFRREIGADIRR